MFIIYCGTSGIIRPKFSSNLVVEKLRFSDQTAPGVKRPLLLVVEEQSSSDQRCNKRQGKWVKFSGTDEELARIALEHARYKVAKAKLRPLLKQISRSMSRRNGFNSQDEDDTVCEHWVWAPNNSYDDNLQLQAINCLECGNYIRVSDENFTLIAAIRCNCDNYTENDSLNEFEEYEYEEEKDEGYAYHT